MERQLGARRASAVHGVRWRSAVTAILLSAGLAACGSDTETPSNTADDDAMWAAMQECVADWMNQAAQAPEVDIATEGELSLAGQELLRSCGSEAISSGPIGQGYSCTGDGCYDQDDSGFTWTRAAEVWACDTRPPWFDASTC